MLETHRQDDLTVLLLGQEADREAEVARLERHVRDLTASLERAHEALAAAQREWRGERAELQARLAQRFEEATVARKEAGSARRAFYNQQERLERIVKAAERQLTTVWEGSDVEVEEAARRLQDALKETPSS